MRKFALGIALATTALATPALAKDKAWYIEGDAGGTLADKQTVTNKATNATIGTFGTKLGYDVGGIIGYDFGHFRLETEASFRRVEEKSFTTANAI